MATEPRVRLSNGTSTPKKPVVSVAYAEETFRVFLKDTTGNTRLSIRCQNEEAAMTEIQLINEQMGW